MFFFENALQEKLLRAAGVRYFYNHQPYPPMKKQSYWPLFILLLLGSCVQDPSYSAVKDSSKVNPLSLLKEDNPEWRHEHLRLYPVVAAAAMLETNASLKSLKTLSEAMKMPGFRVLERKQFGRSEEPWYHALTIQNKTRDTVLLLSGEIVKGGNQDRVIAHHEVILPMTVRNVEVFCVEAGRSSYSDPSAPVAEREAGAFKGYFSIASPGVRRAVHQTGNQQEVWNAVATVTKANKAESATSAYTALDQESAEKAIRDAYLRQLTGKFSNRPEVVGVMAVCGNQIIGTDIFSTHELFERQYPALLHGYVAEAAMMKPGDSAVPAQELDKAFEKISALAAPQTKSNADASRFALGNQWVHLFKN